MLQYIMKCLGDSVVKYLAQARDARTAEVVAIKKMSYSGKQSNEVSFPTFHSHYIQSLCSLVEDSAFPSEGGHRNDCITLPFKDFFFHVRK